MALAGASLLSFVMGSVHSFSVLLRPIEAAFEVERTSSSLTYSFALIALALAVLFGHRFHARFPPAVFALVSGLLAAFGCAIAATGSSVGTVWIGYGGLFGFANGLAYGFTLQFGGRAFPARRGMAMGVVTAAYALGALAFAEPLFRAISAGGFAGAMWLLAGAVSICSVVSAILLHISAVRFDADPESPAAAHIGSKRQVVWLWFGYCLAVMAGLMVIGHAAALAGEYSDALHWASSAPMIVAAANLIGSLLGGEMTDRLPGRAVLAGLAALTVIATAIMGLTPSSTVIAVGLGAVGFAYGGTIAAWPAFLSHRFGPARGSTIYARVFPAWAVAGLTGPTVAAMALGLGGGYEPALIAASLSAFASVTIVHFRVPRDAMTGHSPGI